MGKIKTATKEVYTTTDSKDFTDMAMARKHQMDISEKALATDLGKFLEDMFGLTEWDKINKLYESEKDGDYEKGSAMEEKIDNFINVQCGDMGWVDDMDDLTNYLVGAYKAFSMEQLSDIFMFIDNKMGL